MSNTIRGLGRWWSARRRVSASINEDEPFPPPPTGPSHEFLPCPPPTPHAVVKDRDAYAHAMAARARDAPAIMTLEEAAHYKNVAEDNKVYERPPSRAESVKPLSEPLDLRTPREEKLDADGDYEDFRSPEIDENSQDDCEPYMKSRNILINTFHIYFT